MLRVKTAEDSRVPLGTLRIGDVFLDGDGDYGIRVVPNAAVEHSRVFYPAQEGRGAFHMLQPDHMLVVPVEAELVVGS